MTRPQFMEVDHPAPTTAQLVAYLRDSRAGGMGLLDRLKISYRPYICPFGELLSLVRPQDRVFDIGCGSGQFCLLAARFRQPASIVGVEISERLVENANTLFARASIAVPHLFTTYDGKVFPESLSEADTVFLIDVLHHVPPHAQTAFLHAVHDSMKPGARLVVKDIDAASRLVTFNRLHDRVFSGEVGHELRAVDLLDIARGAGFDVQRISHQTLWVYPHYLCVLEKRSPISPAHP